MAKWSCEMPFDQASSIFSIIAGALEIRTHPWLTTMSQQNTDPFQQGFLPVLRNKVSGSMVPQHDTSDDPDGRLTQTACLLAKWRWHPSPLVSPGCSWSIDPLCKRMALVFADPTSFCQLCPRKQLSNLCISVLVADMWNLHNLSTFVLRFIGPGVRAIEDPCSYQPLIPCLARLSLFFLHDYGPWLTQANLHGRDMNVVEKGRGLAFLLCLEVLVRSFWELCYKSGFQRGSRTPQKPLTYSAADVLI